MIVLGIYGSPRQGGNSDLLLDQALKGAHAAGAEIDTLVARDLPVEGCLACGGCEKTGECVQHDAMGSIYPRLDQARAIILAAPVYFYGFPAQLKALIDRAQARWARGGIEKQACPDRPRHQRGGGYLIGVGATRGPRLFEGLELSARFFLDALDKAYLGALLVRGLEGRGAVLSHPAALAQAALLGRRAAAGEAWGE